MLALIIIGSILLYLSTASIVFSKVVSQFRGDCTSLNSTSIYDNCYHDHGGAAFGLALLWPVTMPGFMVHYNKFPSRASRDEKSRAKELADAEHRIAMAKAEAERIKILENEVGIF